MNKNVALVLSGGGARGIAHIGVIEELERQGFKIKSILNNRIDGKHKKELQKLATILFTNPGNKN